MWKKNLKNETNETKQLQKDLNQCQLCDFKVNGIFDLENHLKSKHGHSYPCDDCDIKSNLEICLREHISQAWFKKYQVIIDFIHLLWTVTLL